MESIIEDGQSDLLRRARSPVVLTSEQAAAFVERFPGEVERLGLDAEAIAELVGGERDVFTSACSDQLAGLHGPADRPCPARPWVRLLCRLAVFMPRHIGNLLRRESFLLRQFRQMPTEYFVRVLAPSPTASGLRSAPSPPRRHRPGALAKSPVTTPTWRAWAAVSASRSDPRSTATWW
ncbi:hypothetical protein [Streptomyces sp. CFMR 7]|uniref:hypothetical protein n=1 Tax=Streptomyces sp. CFMR 7 TaxID=1649184 RepID=UPI001C92CD33|nr:hypothetical protein [Streptomyces sp. CFMR 7]